MKERTFDVSDKFRVHVCTNCGLFAIADLENNNYMCKGCDALGSPGSNHRKIV